MKKFDRSTIIEIAKQSLMLHDIREYLKSVDIEVPSPTLDIDFVKKISEKDFKSETIKLPYQCILGLQNLNPMHEINQIKDLNLDQIIDWIRAKDLRKNRVRSYEIREMAELVINSSTEPPLLLITHGKITIVDGRTRLMLAYGARKDIICEVIQNLNI